VACSLQGVALLAWLIVRGHRFPPRLGYLGYVAAILLLILYFGRLTVLDPRSPVIAVPAILSGFLINPAWVGWEGVLVEYVTVPLPPQNRACDFHRTRLKQALLA
jgi:hypothetical protein